MQASEAAQAWRRDLPREQTTRRDGRGLFLFTRSAVLYLLLFAGAYLLPNVWLRMGCLAAMPVVIGALFVIGHDAGHMSLTRLAALNRLLGRLAMLPAYHPFTSWRYAHNVLHHGGTCLKQKHPDFTPLSKEEFDALPEWRRVLERIYRTPAGVGLSYVIEFYGRTLLFPKAGRKAPEQATFQADRLLVIAFAAAQIVTAHFLTSFTPGLTGRWIYASTVIVPWTIWMYFMGVASFVQHTHPRTVWYDDEDQWSYYQAQLCSSTHMVLPKAAGWLLHNIMDHPAHHIDPTIPLYELPASQRLLEQCAPEHSIVIPFTLGEYLHICRTCKLYDYRRRCWLDFEGRATTEPNG